jgi:hypothetical protein
MNEAWLLAKCDNDLIYCVEPISAGIALIRQRIKPVLDRGHLIGPMSTIGDSS